MQIPFTDDPLLGGAEDDKLDSRAQVHRLLELLGRTRLSGSSIVVSLVGPWGSGKTSVLNQLVHDLARSGVGEEAWIVVPFNPWLYADVDALLMGFISSVGSALPIDRRFEGARKAFGRFGQTLSPLGKLTSLIGVDSTEIIKKAGDLLRGASDATSAQQRLVKELEELNLPLLVVLDDLDRLAPSELLQTFRLVRLVGRLPNTTYLLAYDEATLLDGLARTELAANDPARAADYLEKVVQLRVDMPPMRRAQVDRLVNEGFDTVLQQHELILDDESRDRLGRAYWAVLADVLRTPRALYRLFAQFDAVAPFASTQEVDVVDLFLTTYVRTLEPMLSRQIVQCREELTDGTNRLLSKDNADAARERWIAKLRRAHVRADRVEGTLELLAILFPRLGAAMENQNLQPNAYQAVATRRGVGHRDYFDRYFANAVPAEDIPDLLVREALSSKTNDWESSQRVLLALTQDPGRVLRKIAGSLVSGSDSRLVRAFEWIGVTYAAMPQSGIFGFTGRREAERFVEQRLLAADRPVAIPALHALVAEPPGLALAVRVMAVIKHRSEAPSWVEEAMPGLIEVVRERMAAATETPPDKIGPEPLVFLRAWASLDETPARQWVREQIDTGAWSLTEFAATCVGTSYGGSGPLVADFDPSTLGEWYPLEQAIEELRPRFAEVDGMNLWDAKPTPENKRLAVILGLKELDDRMSAEKQKP